jgi:hypothetical protein
VAVVVTILGVLLVAVALADVFLSLFHPAGRGALSDLIARNVWRIFRRAAERFPHALTFAGPAAFLSTVAAWIWFIVFGVALVLWPHMKADFAFVPGLDPATHVYFKDALNVSLGSLVTLGGDINAKPAWIRFVMGLEGIVGFGLLTAAVSWLLSLYPVLETRRSVAQQATLLHHAELETGISVLDLPASDLVTLLSGLLSEFASLRNQMAQFPIAYYFHMGEEQTALPGILPYIADLAARAAEPGRAPSVRLLGTALGGVVESFLEALAETYLRIPLDDKRRILEAYAYDQMRELVSMPQPGEPRKAA